MDIKKEEIIDMLNIDDFLYKDSIMAIKDEKIKRKNTNAY